VTVNSLHGAPAVKFAPSARSLDSSVNGAASPGPPCASSSSVYPVIWYPAKSHAPPGRADSSPIVPWQTVATGAVRACSAARIRPRSGSSYRSSIGPVPPGTKTASTPSGSIAANGRGCASASARPASAARSCAVRPAEPVIDSSRLYSCSGAATPPGVPSTTSIPAAVKIWYGSMSSSAQKPDGRALPSFIVHFAAPVSATSTVVTVMLPQLARTASPSGTIKHASARTCASKTNLD
jgi:hypothetical protein